MRISIDIDDALIAETLFRTGLPSVDAVIEAALRDIVAKHQQPKPIIDIGGSAWREGLLKLNRDLGERNDRDYT